jgi:hypothetical protein
VVIAVVCPSRGNPKALTEAALSFRDTRMDDTSVFVAAVDEDDPVLAKYVEALEDISCDLVIVPRGESGNMNRALNYAARRYAQRAEIVGFIGDDHRFRTKGWDRVIHAVMKEHGDGLAYGNDLFQGEALPTAVFISSSIVNALGWFGPPLCKHLYLDNTWKILGDRADCLYYLPDVIIEHMHPAAGKGEWDENHIRVNASEVYSHDRTMFESWLANGIEQDVATVKEAVAR